MMLSNLYNIIMGNEKDQSGPGPFDQPDSHRTLAIEVEDRKFYVPRDLMAAYSPIFKAMLYGDFLEAKKDVIELPEKKAKDMEELLQCLIPAPKQKPIDDSNVELIMQLSDEYQIEELQNRADMFLKIQLSKTDRWLLDTRLLEYLELASQYQMKELLMEYVNQDCPVDEEELDDMFKHLPTYVIALLVYSNKVASIRNFRFFVKISLRIARCLEIIRQVYTFFKGIFFGLLSIVY